MFTVINFQEEVLGTFSSINAAIEAASENSFAQWVEDESGNILFIKRRTRKGKAQRAPQVNNARYINVSWNPSDLLECRQACEILIRDGLGLDKLRTLNFGSLDVNGVYEEYFQGIAPAPQSINQLKAEINRLQAEVDCRMAGLENKNTSILMEEVRNLLLGVGEGFIAGNYYAPDRYYSQIEGVKNLREASFDGELYIMVKITSPKGGLLPKQIMVGGTTYKICYKESEKYNREVDY